MSRGVSEMDIDAIFSDFLEKGRTSGGEVSKVYDEYKKAVENYIAAVEKDIFKDAYTYFKENAGVLKA